MAETQFKAGEDIDAGEAVVIGIDGKAHKFDRRTLEQKWQDIISEAFSRRVILGENADNLTDAQKAQKIYDYRHGTGAS